jgi:Ca-activated chloride channel family protein
VDSSPARVASAPAASVAHVARAEPGPDRADPPRPDGPRADDGRPWIGAAGASDFLLEGSRDTVLGVWVDVPTSGHRTRAPVDLALVVDTSGSMAGAKIEHAREAAKALVDELEDGDIVSVHTFDDHAVERLAPTVLDRASRRTVAAIVAELGASGSTNLYEGMLLGESRAASAPSTHAVRRVVLISDGVATVGPSSPELLGRIAARGAEHGVQTTALGVGLDYDEHTLNELAMQSSGRLYHLTDPSQMPDILKSELSLLEGTMATDAVVEVVPAPGVQILGAEGVRTTWGEGGALRIPLGTMFGGQHREMLLHVRVDAAGPGKRPLASVRLSFRDPSEGNLPRVQEAVARYEVTRDASEMARHENARTNAIAAVQEAGRTAIAAASEIGAGRFDAADQQLAVAQAKLDDAAKKTKDAGERQRVVAAASRISAARATAKAASAAPPAAKPAAARAGALDLNSAGMKAMGF